MLTRHTSDLRARERELAELGSSSGFDACAQGQGLIDRFIKRVLPYLYIYIPISFLDAL